MARRRKYRRRKSRGRRKGGMKLKLSKDQKTGLIVFFFVVAAVCVFVKTRLPVVHEKPMRKNAPASRVVTPPAKPQSAPIKPPALTPPVVTPLAPPFVKRTGAYKIGRSLKPNSPKIVIVLDDVGHTTENLELLRGLGNQVTYAILPFLKHSSFFDQYSFETGAEVILHMPLESTQGTIPGPGLILTSMSDQAATDVLRRSLASVPHAQGVNNHMGSKGSADIHLMTLLLREIKNSGLFFLDSMTTPKSVSRSVASSLNFPSTLKRDVFLDNTDTQDAVRNEVRKLAETARQNGYAVGIGHYRYNTMKVLNEEIPRLKKLGYEFISLQELLRLKKR